MTLRFAMSADIRQAGHEPVIAENGEKAVQLVDEWDIDLIIMDVEMPGLNGFETTRLIRENLGERWLPIIFVTGKNDDKSLEQGIAAGGDDYLIKPVSRAILRAKITAMERIANMRQELHELNDNLKRLSQRDSLTQLLNRRTFEERADERWRQATRTQEPLTIMLFDIDYFKRYNDYYGHVAGDECIRQVAHILERGFHRPQDVVARYGGEEFIALLPNTDLEGAEHLWCTIEDNLDALNIEHRESPSYGRVTLSAGGCTLTYTTGATLEQAIEYADRALYNSKTLGRNRATLCPFNNQHDILYLELDDERAAEIELALHGHCRLQRVSELSSIQAMDRAFSPELLLIGLDRQTSLLQTMLDELEEYFIVEEIPRIGLSPRSKTESAIMVKRLKLDEALFLPVDNHALISKINTYLLTK